MPELLHLTKGLTRNLIWNRVAGQRGHAKFIRASNLQTRLKKSGPTSTLHFWQSSLPARESHYSDRNFFCNPRFDQRWSIVTTRKFIPFCSVASIHSQCKQLYRVRIDDHIKKSLNRRTDLFARNFFFAPSKISLKIAVFF